jgi:cytochrome c553
MQKLMGYTTNFTEANKMQCVIRTCFLGLSLTCLAILGSCGGGGGSGDGNNNVSSGSNGAAIGGLTSANTPSFVATTTAITPMATADTPTTPTSTPTSKVITLPIEVLGPAGYVESQQFDLPADAKTADAKRLLLQCHRCNWRDGSVASGQARGAKGSVRINGGSWLDMTDAAVDLLAADKAYGGLSGGLNTTRFTIAIAGVQSGTNTLEFRFNADDGLSNGYRILSLNLLDSSGKKLLLMSIFKNDDPEQWRASTQALDIAEGKALWTGKVALKESPLDTKLLKATCASCHAADGRDLKYFNYSNWSIEARSRFHGLSSQQGQQIAAYIRNLNAPAPEQARPWNPPYQPGAGLDAKPVAEWAAGAGLDAVLTSDAEMLPYLFPNGTSTAAVRAVIDKTKTANIREMPISLQLPDWNDWLPHQHPLDLFETQFMSVPTAANASSINQAYAGMRAFLASAPVANLIPNDALYNKLHAFAYTSSHFHAPNYTLNESIKAGVNASAARSSISRWSAVKQWEVMQEFSLEDKAAQVHGMYGEPRSWLTLSRNVFEIAPHRSADNLNNFPYQSLSVGKYQSTAWYHLQLALNAGNRKGITLSPVDWNYQPEHIVDLKTKAGGPTHSLRWIASHAKMHQQFADGMQMGKTALGFRQIHIQRYVPGQSHGVLLDALPQPLRLNVYEALLASTMDVLEVHSPQVWPRGDHDGGNKVEAADYVLTNKSIPRNEINAMCFASNMANCWYSSIPYFKEIGVSTATINRMVDWGKAMWPAAANNWDALRPS